MATAVQFTQAEFEKFVCPQGFRLLQLKGVTELVYGKAVRHDNCLLTIRIYSTIQNGVSRPVGGDAIRVALFYKKKDNTIVMAGGDKRVHRVAGWKENLQSRIDRWNEGIGPVCGLCGAITILRQPKKGQTYKPFYGCCEYPACRTTMPYNPPAQ